MGCASIRSQGSPIVILSIWAEVARVAYCYFKYWVFEKRGRQRVRDREEVKGKGSEEEGQGGGGTGRERKGEGGTNHREEELNPCMSPCPKS